MPAAVLALLGCTTAAAGGELTDVSGDSASLCIRTSSGAVPVDVEIARTFTQRAAGLSERDALAPRSGMLFVYRRLRPADSGFWMYRTRIPLDIAYLGPAGQIRAIRHMVPCPGDDPGRCRVYRAGVEYHSALEVNGGFFARQGVQVGDRVVVSGPGCPE